MCVCVCVCGRVSVSVLYHVVLFPFRLFVILWRQYLSIQEIADAQKYATVYFPAFACKYATLYFPASANITYTPSVVAMLSHSLPI